MGEKYKCKKYVGTVFSINLGILKQEMSTAAYNFAISETESEISSVSWTASHL